MDNRPPETPGAEKERENWLKSENKFKRYSSRGVVGAAGTAIIAGAIRGLALLGKGVVEKAGIDTNQDPIEAERKIATDQTNKFDFQQIARVGLDQSDIHLNQISDPEIINQVFLRMSADYGNDWLLPPAMDEAGNIIGPVSEAAYNDWVTALQLDPAAAAEFKGNYKTFRDNPQLFSKFLLNHGASQRLVDFLLKADELKIQDKEPDTWQGTTENPDRYEFLQQWLNQHSSIKERGKTELNVSVEQQKQLNEPRADFYNIGTDAIRMARGDPAEGLGFLETAAMIPFGLDNTIEMRGQDLAEIYFPKTGQLENSPLSLVMAGLFLVRIGPNLPKKLIAGLNEGVENIYFWFKLGQGSKMMRELAILGKKGLQFFSKKVNEAKNQ